MSSKISIILALMILSVSCAIFAEFNASSLYSPSQHQLIKYHDSGKYYHDISSIIKKATYYLQFRIVQNKRVSHHRKLAIVMDVDETALSNYKAIMHLDFSLNKKTMQAIEKKAEATPIPFTLALFNYAKEHDVSIFFITSRDASLRHATKDNLHQAGYRHWDVIYFKPQNYHQHSLMPYYLAERTKVTDEGFDIVMNIGNHQSSLRGGKSDITFKLPNPFYHLS